MLFHKKEKNKPEKHETYDREHCRPVLHVSICTGETVAGFQDVRTNKFEDIALIRNDGDLEEFLNKYGIKKEELTKIY
ncbi:MAG: aspartate dehydrogenase [Lachnospiraceae bacterium]|jgi:hypothetical protein